jgi:hypothetical protein
MDTTEQVKAFLRGQNLEQLDRYDEAIAVYESVIAEGFDAIGPYDRLIAIYSGRAQHGDVMRVCDLAVAQVHTYQDKKDWYRTMRDQAEKAKAKVPAAAPRRRTE